MGLKLSKVYVPTHENLKDGWVNLGQDKREYVKIKEAYLLSKEELERVIEDACIDILKLRNSLESGLLSNQELVINYINQILK